MLQQCLAPPPPPPPSLGLNMALSVTTLQVHVQPQAKSDYLLPNHLIVLILWPTSTVKHIRNALFEFTNDINFHWNSKYTSMQTCRHLWVQIAHYSTLPGCPMVAVSCLDLPLGKHASGSPLTAT